MVWARHQNGDATNVICGRGPLDNIEWFPEQRLVSSVRGIKLPPRDFHEKVRWSFVRYLSLWQFLQRSCIDGGMRVRFFHVRRDLTALNRLSHTMANRSRRAMIAVMEELETEYAAVGKKTLRQLTPKVKTGIKKKKGKI